MTANYEKVQKFVERIVCTFCIEWDIYRIKTCKGIE